MNNKPSTYIPQIRFRFTTSLYPMNSYLDKDFFTIAYLTLFPFRIRGYIEDEVL
jgi:hypothetical protein